MSDYESQLGLLQVEEQEEEAGTEGPMGRGWSGVPQSRGERFDQAGARNGPQWMDWLPLLLVLRSTPWSFDYNPLGWFCRVI